MSSSNGTGFRVTVIPPISGISDPLSQIEVFDGHGTRIAGPASGVLSTTLRKGLYTVRTDRLGEMREDVVVHRDGTDLSLPAPLRNSAMPMNDTAHHHEFLQGPAQQFSTLSTFETGCGPDSPRLMIMIRAGNKPVAQQNLGENMTLLDEKGGVVTRFEPESTKATDAVFSLVSALLRPGNYMLSRQTNGRAELLPISLFPRWDCFVFVPFEGRAKLAAASIKMVKRAAGYDPNDTFASELDAAIQGLGNQFRLLPDYLRLPAIYGKFDHPLHGLIGAYAHFQGPEFKQRLEEQVLHNLWHLLPGSADVIALLLMSLKRSNAGLPDSLEVLETAAAEAFGGGVTLRLPLTFPPLMSAGLSAIVQASLDLPGLIEPGSWLDVAANASIGAGVWAIWDQRMPQPAPAPSEPSTQLLYPAVKGALAQRSGKRTRDIFAVTNLRDILGAGGVDVGGLMGDVDARVSGFSVAGARPAINRDSTVRDLVQDVRKEAMPQTTPTAAPQQVVKPVLDVPDWLIDTVHARIEAEGDNFDPKRLARQYMVTTRLVESAATLPRPAADQ